ncbi:MAG: hypothetical protein INF17_14350 [Methylobacterium sp.]|nr:hypothetical protein [Methylobacterium sp.]
MTASKKTFYAVIITTIVALLIKNCVFNDRIEIYYDGSPFFCFIEQHHKAFLVPKNLTGDVTIIIDRTSDYNIIAISDGKKAVILRDYKDFLTLNMKTGCFKIQQE